MSKLSTAQVAALEAVAGASCRGLAFVTPMGPRSRPFKFLKATELIEEKAGGAGTVWITDKGKAELHRQKNGTPP